VAFAFLFAPVLTGRSLREVLLARTMRLFELQIGDHLVQVLFV